MTKDTLPAKLRPLYDSVNNEVIWIHAKWKVHRQVFAGGQEDIDLLNRYATFFFRVVQQTLFENTLLSISRLTDPAKTRGKENRSLEAFIHQVNRFDDGDLEAGLTQDLAEIRRLCEPFRDWRNRRIAHSDLPTALKVDTEPLPGISRASIEEALAAIRKFMNRINAFFFDSETAYEHFSTMTGGDQLLVLLARADKSIREEQENLARRIDSFKSR
jgi:hypothetical protein